MGAFPEQRMSILTLAVSDLDASRAFYRDILGLKPFMTDNITMFDMGGFVLGLWDHDKLQDDIGHPAGAPFDRQGSAMALAYNARSEAEVDTIFEALRAHDVTISKPPHKAFWGGYSGYFLDPDGHAWEVAYNPFWGFEADGRLKLPQQEAV